MTHHTIDPLSDAANPKPGLQVGKISKMITGSHRYSKAEPAWIGTLLLVGLLVPAIALAQDNGLAKRPKIGVAFEGGGALGLGHVGVLEWLEKNHIPVDYIAGTSMGGLVGGLYATGNNPSEIRALIRTINWDEALGGRVPFGDLRLPAERRQARLSQQY